MTERAQAEGPATGPRTSRRDSATIKTEKLRKEFGDLVAVEGLDMTIRKGVLYGMIGPNGSGKTTTIRMLVGLTRPTGGKAWVLDEEVPLKRRVGSMGYMPQEMAIYTDLTVHENLELFSKLYSMDETAFAEREKELLRMIDLEDRRDSLVSQLSGGMRHRVSLACALVHDPDVLFLDEPTVGVDPELRAGFWKYFADLKARGKTIVLTTHYMDEATRCDIVGMMRLGELIAEGAPSQLMADAGAHNLEDAFMHYARRSGE